MTVRPDRPTARILLVDDAGRLLLFRFDPPNQPPFWCTPGGGLDPGESYAEAARRELREETGIDAEIGSEVASRIVAFTTADGVAVIADERYFLVRTGAPKIATNGHTELEQRVIRDWRWFSRADLARHDEQIYPENLIDMLDQGGAAT